MTWQRFVQFAALLNSIPCEALRIRANQIGSIQVGGSDVATGAPITNNLNHSAILCEKTANLWCKPPVWMMNAAGWRR